MAAPCRCRVGDLRSDRHSEDPQIAAVVALHQNADRVAALCRRQHARGGADTALESIAAHSRATADGAFLHWPGLCPIERLKGVDGLHVFAVGVVQEIKRLGDDRVGEHELPAVLQLPLNRRVANRADAVRARQQNRSLEKPGFLDPVDAGHVAVAVLIERRGKHRIPVAARARKNGRDARADRALPGTSLPSPSISVTCPTAIMPMRGIFSGAMAADDSSPTSSENATAPSDVKSIAIENAARLLLFIMVHRLSV